MKDKIKSLMFALLCSIISVAIYDQVVSPRAPMSPIPAAKAGTFGGYDRSDTTSWNDGHGGRCVMNTDTGAVSCFAQCR